MALDSVLYEAERWGIVVARRSILDGEPIAHASATHRAFIYADPSVTDPHKRLIPVVVWDDGTSVRTCCPQALLHEIVHAVVWRRTGLAPNEQSDLMNVGLEVEALKRLGMRWAEWSRRFIITPVPCGEHRVRRWHATPPRTRAAILDLSRLWLTDVGLMKAGCPTYVRSYSPDVQEFIADAACLRTERIDALRGKRTPIFPPVQA